MCEIIQQDHPTLRQIAKEVPLDEISSSKFQNLIKKMHDTLATQNDGVALAAPQINEPWRIFVVSEKVFNNKSDKNLVYINPSIINHSKKKDWVEEGCLSVRWLYGQVKRFSHATVQAYNENGELFERGSGGLLAQIFQHEIDHLNGVLFTDKAVNVEEIPPEQL